MKLVRGAILTIIATFGLIAGVAATAYADDGVGGSSAVPAETDPGDPGLPPD